MTTAPNPAPPADVPAQPKPHRACLRKWLWLKRNKEQLTIVFAVLAAGWGLWEYYGKQQADKRTETLRYIERYYGTSYLTAKSALNAVLFEKEKQITFIRDRRDPAKLEAFVAANQIRPHILTLVEMYDSLAGCVSADICDRNTACRYFASDIDGLYNSFRPLFQQSWKEMWGEDFMARAAAFAKKCAEATARNL